MQYIGSLKGPFLRVPDGRGNPSLKRAWRPSIVPKKPRSLLHVVMASVTHPSSLSFRPPPLLSLLNPSASPSVLAVPVEEAATRSLAKSFALVKSSEVFGPTKGYSPAAMGNRSLEQA